MRKYTLYEKVENHEKYKKCGRYKFGRGYYNNKNLDGVELPISKDIDVIFKLSNKSTFNKKIWIVKNKENNSEIGFLIFRHFIINNVKNIYFKYYQGFGFLQNKDNLMWLVNIITLCCSFIALFK